ncbi:hypothetical protein BN6_49840 [Saccharothrix espanaensis DSM 44229]|uniref:Uncharacterized protein n=1 Tax=Saccharothrix espanaensis (strain ATCC 51144 / DSM 44229 / JCM 9112 / NBRC 15066 / NRRL 15764) TaxID=1179773 RepID=K0K6Q3_SACES|nr:hypothetical protein BN6_49840 [Saccharothrix espanaensis DSM 44229]
MCGSRSNECRLWEGERAQRTAAGGSDPLRSAPGNAADIRSRSTAIEPRTVLPDGRVRGPRLRNRPEAPTDAVTGATGTFSTRTALESGSEPGGEHADRPDGDGQRDRYSRGHPSGPDRVQEHVRAGYLQADQAGLGRAQHSAEDDMILLKSNRATLVGGEAACVLVDIQLDIVAIPHGRQSGRAPHSGTFACRALEEDHIVSHRRHPDLHYHPTENSPRTARLSTSRRYVEDLMVTPAAPRGPVRPLAAFEMLRRILGYPHTSVDSRDRAATCCAWPSRRTPPGGGRQAGTLLRMPFNGTRVSTTVVRREPGGRPLRRHCEAT